MSLVDVKIGVERRSSAAAILGAIAVVRVGNTVGTGASWSETGNLALAVELFFVVRVEYAYSQVYLFLMVDVMVHLVGFWS